MNKDFWERIDRLEELAKKAMPDHQVVYEDGEERYVLTKFIAAANPAMILEMIAEMRRLENENDRLKIELHDMDSSAREMWNDMKQLEKEADWLASKCSGLSSNAEGCEDCCLNGECPHNDIHTETMCTEPQDWREAARKVVSEADNA